MRRDLSDTGAGGDCSELRRRGAKLRSEKAQQAQNSLRTFIASPETIEADVCPLLVRGG